MSPSVSTEGRLINRRLEMVRQNDLDETARLVAWGYVADRFAILLSRLKAERIDADSPEFVKATRDARELLTSLKKGAEEAESPAFDRLSVHAATAVAYYQTAERPTEDWGSLLADLDERRDIEGLRVSFSNIGIAMGRAAQQAAEEEPAWQF